MESADDEKHDQKQILQHDILPVYSDFIIAAHLPACNASENRPSGLFRYTKQFWGLEIWGQKLGREIWGQITESNKHKGKIN